MSGVDIEELLRELSPESPCGDNLEYDEAFGELERSAQSKPEQQFGNTVIPGEEPDYREVKKLASDLAHRTKDLRVAALLARALVNTDSFAGLNDALALIHGYVERYWERLHPLLDPDDDNDPTLRVNTVCSLCDPKNMLLPLQRAPLVSSLKAGRFGLIHIAMAKGERPPDPDVPAPPDPALIEAAFLDADPDQLRSTQQAIVSAAEHARQIEQLVTREVGASRAGSLAPLTDLLFEAGKILSDQLARRGLNEPPVATSSDVEESSTEVAAATARTENAMASNNFDIRSRHDVVRVLDLICAYYEQHEPSSPVPLLLLRAKRLVSMSFLEVLRELAPDGVPLAEAIGGFKRDE